MSKKLTSDYIRLRTKCDKLEGIKNLNLWGCDLEDISIIKDLPNLEVVSLSINKIKTLRDFANLRYLRELYIRKNMVSELTDVNYLKKCNNLRTLWLNENPLAENKNYRAYVIKTLPQIVKLDDVPITNEERNNLNNFNVDEIEINDKEESSDQEQNYEEEYKTDKNTNYQKANNFEERNLTSKPSFNYDEKPLGSKPSYNYEDRPIGSKPIYKQQTDNLYSAKRSETKKGPSPNTRINSDLNENENERKRYRPEKEEVKPIQRLSQKNNEINPAGKIKNETVVNCVMMLINELGIDDIEKIRKELDKISSTYYNEN